MKMSLKLRAVVSPTPAIIAAAYAENGKADVCTLYFKLEATDREAGPFLGRE